MFEVATGAATGRRYQRVAIRYTFFLLYTISFDRLHWRGIVKELASVPSIAGQIHAPGVLGFSIRGSAGFEDPKRVKESAK